MNPANLFTGPTGHHRRVQSRRRIGRARWAVRAVAAITGIVALAGCSSVAPSAGGDPSATPPPANRPNIVFVLTDDVAVNLMQYMPHVAAMEQEGTTFENHFVVDSLCCPSRTSIFTGEYPHDDGVFTNGGADGGYPAFNRNGDAINSFAPALQRAGYRTALLGKYLNEYLPNDPPALGWDEWDVGGYAYPEFNYDLNQNGKVQHYGSAPSDYLTNVLSQKATRLHQHLGAAGQAVRPRGRDVRRALPVHAGHGGPALLPDADRSPHARRSG